MEKAGRFSSDRADAVLLAIEITWNRFGNHFDRTGFDVFVLVAIEKNQNGARCAHILGNAMDYSEEQIRST